MKIHRFIWGLCSSLLLLANVYAKDIQVNNARTPLKDVLTIFAKKQPVNFKEYLNIKGIRWNKKTLDKSKAFPGSFDNVGNIHLTILGQSEISLSGDDNLVNEIRIESSKPKPSTKYKQILEANIGKGTVKELMGCIIGNNTGTYEINLENGSTVYLEADASLSFEPFMSPLYTLLLFYTVKPSEWECH